MLRLLRSSVRALRHRVVTRAADAGALALAAALDRAEAHDPRSRALASHPATPSVNGGAGSGARAVAWNPDRTIRHDRKEDPMTDKTTPDAPDTETVDPDTVDPETATDPEGDPVENPSG
ncbi:hypothetical protein NB037_10320 [Rathayibacter sp. ZW T2_19]|uniref:Uncharacterized protein n=1 Tax=Rathayibacter rubneri TaxID=2950106 RepID=A0A9X2DX88_9MICO|nr:hypothetical protein [Rathayibacter rubneri]MCM6762810.1 hypothetical protein [Rathayibacter rubneri]